ncbi:MAG TPA: hypothetical protein VGQ09_07000 [Chitinophagaceae bacterium]|jgi:hypothetical protein|nr:hypothetical protein [Chitinophagaceae bacterium]
MDEAVFFQEIIKELEPAFKLKDRVVNKQLLIDKINQLIHSDFLKLVSLLYRLDISEQKLKQLLNEHKGVDAAVIITDLIIERQLQKIKAKESFKPDSNIPENEKW